MILVAIMVVLSLVSCGYSIASENMSDYATLSAEDKAAFEAALKNLVIEDGDYTANPETRAKKLTDTIYAALASVADTTNKKTEGTPSGHDLVYYCYYCTAEFDGQVVVLYADKMKSSSPTSIQLGMLAPEAFEQSLTAALTTEFKDKAYTAATSGTAKQGDVAYGTYTYTYTVSKDGIETEESKTVTNGQVVIGGAVAEGATAANLAEALNGKNVGTSISNFKLTDATLGEVSYSAVKINWIAKGAELAQIKDVTYDYENNVTDTNGVQRNLKDVELTYHIYPVSYVKVDEYTATNVMNLILGSKVTTDIFYEIVFGKDFADKSDEDKKAILDKYVSKDADGKDVSLEALITAIAKLQGEIASAKTALETTKSDLTKKQSEYDSAKKKYDDKVKEAGEEGATAEQEALRKADEALNGKKNDKGELEGGAKKAAETAQTNYDDKIKARDEKLATLFALDGGKMEQAITDGYKASTEHVLIDTYNNEIKMNLAKEIYYYIDKYVKVTAYPEKAVEATYDQLMQNYQHDFRNGEFDSTNKISNYKQYKGDFKEYLVAKVTADIKTVKTYAEAVEAVREEAKTYVEPIVKIYLAADVFEALATEAEYKEYMKDTDNNYSYNEYYYGANSVRYAFQFDKLMNSLLESEEDENGVVTYSKVTYVFGTPASESEAE